MTVFLSLLVMTSMLGVGAFSLAPALANHLPDPGHQMLFWFLGALYVALGVASYRQLMLGYQVAGGEYGILRRYGNTRLAQLAGICSVLAGFAVPAALSLQILARQFVDGWGLAAEYLPWVAAGLLVALGGLARNGHGARYLCLGLGLLILTALALLLASAVSLFPFAISAPGSAFAAAPEPAHLVQLPLFLAFAFSGFNALIYLPEVDRLDLGRRVSAMRWGAAVAVALIVLTNVLALRLAPVSLQQGADAILALATQLPALGVVVQWLWLGCLLGTAVVSMLLAPGVLKAMRGRATGQRKVDLPIFVAITAVLAVIPLPASILAAGGFFLLVCSSACIALTLRAPSVSQGFTAWWERYAPRCFIGANLLVLLALCWQQPSVLLITGLLILIAGASSVFRPLPCPIETAER